MKNASKAKVRRKARPAKALPVATFDVRELDPIRKCGAGTSVQFLFRVIERLDKQPATNHLVFFDRHGWYCEHGRSCAAVAQARKIRRGLPRAS